jgi:hypothetical protein
MAAMRGKMPACLDKGQRRREEKTTPIVGWFWLAIIHLFDYLSPARLLGNRESKPASLFSEAAILRCAGPLL